MKVKTATLSCTQIDWVVAKCGNVRLLDPNNEWESCWTLLGDDSGDYYSPSTDWSQGGPLIERENINIIRCDDTDYDVEPWAADKGEQRRDRLDGCSIYVQSLVDLIYGPTPLIAAMRCYVASKLGDEVEIPDELLKT